MYWKKYDAEVVRYFLSSVHYRSYIDYSESSLKEARSALERFYQALNGVNELYKRELKRAFEKNLMFDLLKKLERC